MAKKDKTVLIALVCKTCKSQNYILRKSKINNPEKFLLSKYCKMCKKHTEHKETEKLD